MCAVHANNNRFVSVGARVFVHSQHYPAAVMNDKREGKIRARVPRCIFRRQQMPTPYTKNLAAFSIAMQYVYGMCVHICVCQASLSVLFSLLLLLLHIRVRTSPHEYVDDVRLGSSFGTGRLQSVQTGEL